MEFAAYTPKIEDKGDEASRERYQIENLETDFAMIQLKSDLAHDFDANVVNTFHLIIPFENNF